MRRAYSWERARELVEVLDRDLGREERLEVLEVVLLHDDHDLVDAGLEGLFDDQQDRGLRDAVPVDDREQLLLRRLARGEQPRAEAGRRDQRAAHARAGAERERQAGDAEVALEDLDRGLLVRCAAGDELRRAVALRADALAAVHVRLQRRVREHPVQHGGGELLRAQRRRVAVEQALRLAHQGAQPLRVARRAGPPPPRARCGGSSARAAPARRARARPRRRGRPGSGASGSRRCPSSP